MDANLDLNDLERVEISLQNLIGANHINCDAKMIIKRGHEYVKDDTRKKEEI